MLPASTASTTTRATEFPAPTLDLAELADHLTELAAHLSAATCRLLEMIREFDRRGGWHDAGHPEFTTPGGEPIPTAPETRYRGNALAMNRSHRQACLEIGPRTLLPNWRGERMDDAMAVEALLQREQVPTKQ